MRKMVGQRVGTKSVAMALAAALLLAACGSSATTSAKVSTTKSSGVATSSNSTGGSIQFDVFAPFSGSKAGYGQHGIEPGVLAGIYAVNQAGGILGKKIHLMTTDSTSDAADAVPNAHELVAVHGKSINGIFGLDSGTSAETTRIFNAAGIPTFTASGTTAINKLDQHFIYRPYPPDNIESYAMAAAALAEGYKRAAIAYTQGHGVGQIPYLTQAFTKGGGKIVTTQILPIGATSYIPVIDKILQAKPQVIFQEVDPQSGSTFYTELKSVNGSLLPTIDTSTDPSIVTAIAKALGETPNQLGKYLYSVQPQTANKSVYASFVKVFKLANKGASPYNGYNAAYYDSVIQVALAMTLAKSTVASDWITKVKDVTNNESAPVCSSYSSCLTYAKSGKPFRFVGAAGPMYYNHYHWTTGQWVLAEPNSQGGTIAVKTISGKQIAAVS